MEGSSSTHQPQQRLSAIGEFRLIQDVIFSAANEHGVGTELGDDCAYVEVGNSVLALSADAGPKPLVQVLPGQSEDYEAAGWHAVVATASDIATTGARPLCIVNTVDAPPDLEVSALRRYMNGIFSACNDFGFISAGGDIRQGRALSVRIFGVGVVEHGTRIGRSGAASGDYLVLIGPAGRFISTFLEAERLGFNTIDEARRAHLRFPRAQIGPMQILSARGLIVAASDSSDGVLGAISNIVSRSQCKVVLELSNDILTEDILREAPLGGYCPWNLFFFWGDWSVVAAVNESRMAEFRAIADTNLITWTELGRVHGPSGAAGGEIEARLDDELHAMSLVRNENFSQTGFNLSVREHVRYMLTAPLFM